MSGVNRRGRLGDQATRAHANAQSDRDDNCDAQTVHETPIVHVESFESALAGTSPPYTTDSKRPTANNQQCSGIFEVPSHSLQQFLGCNLRRAELQNGAAAGQIR